MSSTLSFFQLTEFKIFTKRYNESHYIDEYQNINDLSDLNLIEPFQEFPGAVILNENLGRWL